MDWEILIYLGLVAYGFMWHWLIQRDKEREQKKQAAYLGDKWHRIDVIFDVDGAPTCYLDGVICTADISGWMRTKGSIMSVESDDLELSMGTKGIYYGGDS